MSIECQRAFAAVRPTSGMRFEKTNGVGTASTHPGAPIQSLCSADDFWFPLLPQVSPGAIHILPL